MTDETLQFEISQYLDGTLPEPNRSALEARLKTDAGAQKVLAEFRRINDLLDAALPVPDIDWDTMQRKISAAVAQTPTDDSLAAAAAEARVQPASHWKLWGSFALAASLLLVASAALVIWNRPKPSAPSVIASHDATPAPAKPLVQVAVLTASPAAGSPVADIQIGEARVPARQDEALYPPDLTVVESRVSIAGLPVLPDDDLMVIQ